MNCPLPTTLQKVLDETLPADEMSSVQAHLESCASCQATIEKLAAGAATWDKAAQNLGEPPSHDEAALFNAVEKLQDPSSSPSHTQAHYAQSGEEEDLSFLQPSQKPGSLGRLADFEILSVVGRGGFGIVLKAFDETLHRIVAVKVMLAHMAANGAARARFIKEAQAAAAVSHDNVVTIHAVGKDAKMPYLAMQFVSGQTLNDKIDHTGALGVTEILRIGMQIADGLAAAHKQGLVHRDIKPANILLENGVERVKITDFGLARTVNDASITQSGTVAGTPMYMSPEQANGEAVDHRSDLFSLGSVMYVMCTGRAPFRANSTLAVMKRVAEETPTPIREINPDIPDWLCGIVTKLHAKTPDERFQMAKEVAELLGQYLADVQAGRVIEARAEPPLTPVATPAPLNLTSALGGLLYGPGIFGMLFVAFASILFPFASYWQWSAQTSLLVGVGLSAALALLLWVFAARMQRSRLRAWARQVRIAGVLCGMLAFVCVAVLALTPFQWQRPTGRQPPHIVVFNEDPDVELQFYRLGETKPVYPPNKAVTAHNFQGEPGGGYLLLGVKDGKIYHREIFTVQMGDRKAFTWKVGSEWVHLFDGKDQSGWIMQGDWTVNSAGQLVGTAKPRSYAFTQRDDYQDFHLRAELKIAKGSGAVFVRSTVNQTPTVRPAGCFALLANSPPFGTLMVPVKYSEDARMLAQAVDQGIGPNEWFCLDIIARGNQLTVQVNGKTVAEHNDDRAMFSSGRIGLEAFAPGTVITFKTIEIKELPPIPRSKVAGWIPLFNGKDLSGWTGASDSYFVKKDGSLQANPVANEYAMLRTTKSYDNYELRLQCRVAGEGQAFSKARAGVALQVTNRADLTDPTYGVAIALTSGRDPDMKAHALGEVDDVLPYLKSKGPAADGWNDLRVVCLNKNVTIYYNGEKRWVCRRRTTLQGQIGLWALDGEAYFRNIEIKELPPPAGPQVPVRKGREADLYALGIAYHEYCDKHRQAPSQASDLQPHLAKNADAWRILNDGSLIFHYDVSIFDIIKDAPKYVLAYDKKTSESGGLVLMADGIAKEVTAAEFKVLPLAVPMKTQNWIQLFNGKDKTGWQALPGGKGTWEVKDKILIGKGDYAYMRTDAGPFGDFHLRTEAKLVSGSAELTVREQSPDVVGGGYDISMVHNPKGYLNTGSLLIKYSRRDTGKIVPYLQALTKPDEWFTLEVIGKGNQFKTFVNGTPALDFVDADKNFGKGFIGLAFYKVLDKPGELHVKKMEIKKLEEPPKEPGWEQLFNGKDLADWKALAGGKGKWQVKDQVLVGKGEALYVRCERGPFADIHVRAEAKVVDGVAGLIVREQSPEILGAGYETTLANAPNGELNTGSLSNKVNKKSTAGPVEYQLKPITNPDEWFTLEIIAKGYDLQTFVNGKKVVHLTDFRENYRKGFVCLRVGDLSGAVGEVHFKKIEIKELPLEESFWLKPFAGKDLKDWVGDTNAWTIQDGMLVREKTPVKTVNANDLISVKKYKNFELRFQARSDSDFIRAAVLVRGSAGVPLSFNELGGFSADLDGGGTQHKRPTNRTELAKMLNALSDFNHFRLKCQGKRVTLSINGVTTIDQEFPELADEGPIGFRARDAKSALSGLASRYVFRDVQIRILPDE